MSVLMVGEKKVPTLLTSMACCQGLVKYEYAMGNENLASFACGISRSKAAWCTSRVQFKT